jgi:hypothetical protein
LRDLFAKLPEQTGTENIRPLIYWVAERELIRRKKEAGLPPPWTQDLILQNYRFCNVRRRHDRVSRWLIENLLNDSVYQYWVNDNVYDYLGTAKFMSWSVLCRFVNWPPTLIRLRQEGLWPGMGRIPWDTIGETIDKIEGKAWTGAYMVRAPAGKGTGKGIYVACDVAAPVEERVGELLEATKQGAEATWSLLKGFHSFGSFMAGQIVADWSYMCLLRDAPDLYTWAPQGPGSKRGFNRLMGRSLNQLISQEEWVAKLVEWRNELINYLGSEYADLTLHDLQNCLCELDKFLRAKNGEGRPRSFYKPEGAY